MEPPPSLCRRFGIPCLRKQQRHTWRQSAEPPTALVCEHNRENCHMPAGGTYSRPASQADARDFNFVEFRPAILTLLVCAIAADLSPPVTAVAPAATSLTAGGFRGSCKRAFFLGALFWIHSRWDHRHSEKLPPPFSLRPFPHAPPPPPASLPRP